MSHHASLTRPLAGRRPVSSLSAFRQERATQLAPSSTISAAVLKAFQWRSIGPARGGRSIAVSGASRAGRRRPTPARPAAGCGRRPTAARRGRPSPTARSHSSSVGAVAVSESNPDIVFIGMGESCIRGNIHAGRRRLQVHRRRQDVDACRLRRLATRSRRSASTRRTPTSSSSRTSANTARRATSAASTRAPTAARRGRRRCSATTRPAPSTSRSIARIRT